MLLVMTFLFLCQQSKPRKSVFGLRHKCYRAVCANQVRRQSSQSIGELPKLCVKIRPDSWLVCGPFRCHRRWQRNGPQTNQLSGRIFTHNLGNSPILTVHYFTWSRPIKSVALKTHFEYVQISNMFNVHVIVAKTFVKCIWQLYKGACSFALRQSCATKVPQQTLVCHQHQPSALVQL